MATGTSMIIRVILYLTFTTMVAISTIEHHFSLATVKDVMCYRQIHEGLRHFLSMQIECLSSRWIAEQTLLSFQSMKTDSPFFRPDQLVGQWYLLIVTVNIVLYKTHFPWTKIYPSRSYELRGRLI